MANEELTMSLSVLPGAMTGISTLMAGMVSINNVFMDMTRQIDSTFGLVDATIVTAGTVIAQFGLQAAEAYGQFEQGMKIVQMVSGQTKSDIEQLSQAANQFSVQYRTDIDQITEGLQTLGRAGLNSASEQTEVLQNGLNTAKLEGRDLNGVLEELIQNTALLGGNLKENNFGEDSGYVNDLLVATSMSAPITTHDVSETLKYSGGIAAAAGARVRDEQGNEDEHGKAILEDYMGAIAAFAQKGVTGSIAGTALRAFFNKPATQDSSVTEALGMINLKPEYLWEDDEETMKPVSEQIGIIQKQMDKLNISTMDRLQIWSKIVGGKMGQQMMKLDSSDIKELTKDIQAADSAGGLAADSMKTYQANMKEMSEQGQVAFRQFGGYVAQFINPFLDVITEILKLFSNPIASAMLFAGFLGAIGKVASVIKKILTNLKEEFATFMGYFKSGETLMAMKPSVERGLNRKGNYSDYSKAKLPEEINTIDGAAKAFRESAKRERFDYLKSKGLSDAQIAAEGITSKWGANSFITGVPDSKIMKELIRGNALSSQMFNDIFVLSVDEWREKWSQTVNKIMDDSTNIAKDNRLKVSEETTNKLLDELDKEGNIGSRDKGPADISDENWYTRKKIGDNWRTNIKEKEIKDETTTFDPFNRRKIGDNWRTNIKVDPYADLKKKFLEESEPVYSNEAEQFSNFYSKNADKLIAKFRPLNFRYQIPFEQIMESYMKGLVPQISKKDFGNLIYDKETGSTIKDVFGNQHGMFNKVYKDFTNKLENGLKLYLEELGEQIPTHEKKTYSTLEELKADKQGRKTMSKKDIASILDARGVDYGGDINKIKRNDLINLAGGHILDWEKMNWNDFRKFAKDEGVSAKGSREDIINRLNEKYRNELTPEQKNWLDDFDNVTKELEGVHQENQRLIDDIKRMREEVAAIKANREKREELENWDPVENARKKREENDELLKNERQKIHDDLNGKYWSQSTPKQMYDSPIGPQKVSQDLKNEFMDFFYNQERKTLQNLHGGKTSDVSYYLYPEEHARGRSFWTPEDSALYYNPKAHADNYNNNPFAGMGPGSALAAYNGYKEVEEKSKRQLLREKMDNISSSVGSGLSGFFSSAKERLTRNREGRMIGYANATTKFQKLTNVVGNVTDLAGGPLMIAMEGLTLIINYIQGLYDDYCQSLKEAKDAVKEAYSNRSQVESDMKQLYNEQNPEAEKDEADDYVLEQYGKMYDSLRDNNADFRKWIEATSHASGLPKKYETDEEADDGSMKEAEEEEKSEEEALQAAINENSYALYEATAQLQLATDKLVTKMQDGMWGMDGESSVFSDALGQAQDTWFGLTEGSGSIENGGFLKTASQKDENYAGDTELTGLLLEDFKDAQGDWRKGLKTVFGKDFKAITSTMNSEAIGAANSMATFSNSLGKKGNARLQSSMMNDRKSWQKLAKEMAKYEKKTGKHAMTQETTNKRMENLIKKLQIDTHLSRQQVIAAAQLQQLQDMYQVAEQTFVPLMADQATTAAQLYDTTAGGVYPTTGEAAGGAVSTAANAAQIAAYLSVMAQNAAIEASYQQDLMAGRTEAKSKEEYLKEAVGSHIEIKGYNDNGAQTIGGALGIDGDYYFGGDKEKQKRIAHALEYQGDRLRNPEWSDQQVSDYSKRINDLIDQGTSFGDAMELARKNYAGAVAPLVHQAYLSSGAGEDEPSSGGGGGGGGGGSGSGDKDKDTGTKKERVDLVLCNKKEIPKLNVNLFKKPPTFTVLNKNFKLRDVKINTEDKPKAIMSSIKNAFIDVQKRTDPKIIQDEEAEYDPAGATDGNALPSGSSKPKTT